MAARAFYAEFDDVKGPCVCYDEPRGCLTGDPDGRRIWETYSDYVITGQGELDGVVVQVRAGRDGVVCVPVVCQDEQKYARNALLFSLGVGGTRQRHGRRAPQTRAEHAVRIQNIDLRRVDAALHFR